MPFNAPEFGIIFVVFRPTFEGLYTGRGNLSLHRTESSHVVLFLVYSIAVPLTQDVWC
jgi:hypothetical protein